MQYITQCPHYSRLITRRFRKNNYLLFQIVKEQPIVPTSQKEHRSMPGRALIDATSHH
jgi:hypothetical protein